MARAWLLGVLIITGCATTPDVPPAGTRYVRTVKVVNEASLVGRPYRQRVEQEFVWNVGIAREGELTLVTQQLQRLAVRVNGLDVIDGERVPGSNVSVDLLVSR